jgi:hypothetical protein
LTRALVSWTEKYILGEDLTPPFRFDFRGKIDEISKTYMKNFLNGANKIELGSVVNLYSKYAAVLTFINPSGTPKFIRRCNLSPLHVCHDKFNF